MNPKGVSVLESLTWERGGGRRTTRGEVIPKMCEESLGGVSSACLFCTSGEEEGVSTFVSVPGIFFRQNSVFDPRTAWRK